MFVGNGLRMAWNPKGRGEVRCYVPTFTQKADGALQAVAPDDTRGVSALRRWLHTLSVRRSSGEQPARVALEFRDCVELSEAESRRQRGGGGAGAGVGGNLATVLAPDIVDALNAALPEVHRGTLNHVSVKDSVAFLRSSSKYCENVGRDHTHNTIYYLYRLLSGKLEQRCFSRLVLVLVLVLVRVNLKLNCTTHPPIHPPTHPTLQVPRAGGGAGVPVRRLRGARAAGGELERRDGRPRCPAWRGGKPGGRGCCCCGGGGCGARRPEDRAGQARGRVHEVTAAQAQAQRRKGKGEGKGQQRARSERRRALNSL